MALFQLDADSISVRARAALVRPPPLGATIARGAFGFMLVSVAGFTPWVICERWLRGATELQMHIACAVVFIVMSGICLHGLILGPGSFSRFYKVFALAFTAYAAAWMGFWMWRPDDTGCLAGLAAGTAAMGVVFACAFDAWRGIFKIVGALFLLNALGYYSGEWAHGQLAIEHRSLGMLLWGACYGLSLGAGLGVAFHVCQERARVEIRAW